LVNKLFLLGDLALLFISCPRQVQQLSGDRLLNEFKSFLFSFMVDSILALNIILKF
jgi:hypothetical protein